MRKTFSNAITHDPFKNLIFSFYNILETELISTPINNEGMSIVPNFNKDNIKNIHKRLDLKVCEEQQKINENLIELTKSEKFYYIQELIINFKKNSFSSTNDLFDDLIKIKATRHFDDFMQNEQYENILLGPLYNENKEFKEEFNNCFFEYADSFLSHYEELYNYIEIIRNQYELGQLTDESRLEVNEFILSHKPVFTLPNDFRISKIKNGKVKLTNLTKAQVALLFEFLCEVGAFLDFDKKTKAYFTSLFTGLSEQNLRNNFIDFDAVVLGKDKYDEDKDEDIKEVQKLLDKFQYFISKRQNEIKLRNQEKSNLSRRLL